MFIQRLLLRLQLSPGLCHADLLDLLSPRPPVDLSGFSVSLYYTSVPLFVGQVFWLARVSAFPHTVWMHDLIRTNDHALEI